MGNTPQRRRKNTGRRIRRSAPFVASALLLLALQPLALQMLTPPPSLYAQDPETDPAAQVEAILSAMTVEEKVGQIFLVTFVGNDASPGTDVAKLIRQDHVGGVVLLAANSNFINGTDTPGQVAGLTNGLQALAMEGSTRAPLFIAVDHEGDGYPYTRITGGTTPLPNAMAIGATWDVDNAYNVGQITGLELAAMGINLLLGPVVDVLNNPQSGSKGDMGTRTFGGDPWWVGQMGQAYIQGVHQGSGGRVATVAKHFPGHGGSDRLPDEEVATVDKEIKELKRVELAPFITVTNGEFEAITDALMSSHIRYRGLQGNVRQFTAPISFDGEAMGAILDLEEFAGWHAQGLMVSDSLGVPAVRKYFDPTLTTFPHRRIAKEAFLAGNDLLLLAQFDLNNVWPDQVQNIRDTIAFFRNEYQANPSFAARVDEAVAKILRLKLKLYPEFALEAVQVHPNAAVQVCGLGTEVTQAVANQALTLLYPDPNAVPAAPRRGEKLLILTDARPVRECFTDQCQSFSPLSQTAVEDAISRIYGPGGTDQVALEDMTSLPFGQLIKFLSGEETQYDMGTLLEKADWIIFAQQDLDPIKGPNSDAVKVFLNHSASSAYDARLVVLAFNAPYYLDTTEISKLHLYMGVYSKPQPFVETAVRALFGELVPQGASPVDVTSINYQLSKQLEPDPDQIIPLTRLEPTTDGPFHPPLDVLLQAGPLMDHNGNPVADGTLVTFYAEYGDGTLAPSRSAKTAGAMAQTTLTLNESGQLQFRVESGGARQSQTVGLTLQAHPTTTPVPTLTPFLTSTPRPTHTPAPSPTIPPSPTAEIVATPSATGPTRGADSIDLLLAAGATLLVAMGGYLLLGERKRKRKIVVRWILLAIIGGMAGYILYASQLIRPETWQLLPQGNWATRLIVVGVVLVAALVPLALILGTTDAHKP